VTIFKKLSVLVCVSLGMLYSSVEEEIQQNEIVIDTLQKQLETASLKKDEKLVKALQSHIDSVVVQQNKLLEQKATGNVQENLATTTNNSTESLDAKLRRMIQEELAKAGVTPKLGSPYDTTHAPTPAELAATNAAQKNAPILPEQKSEAMAQYELALELYNKKEYKGAMAGFSRIIQTYKTDPIAAKAMVHLAYCFEKQGRLEDASIVCNAALQEKLDDLHQVDCQFICLKFAKSKGNEADVARIVKSLKSIPLTAEQQQALDEIQGKKTATVASVPVKVPQPSASGKESPAMASDSSSAPKASQSLTTPAAA
jgi:TolA-binding protein